MSDTFVEPELTTFEQRPRFEGNNIMTWIGFKHVMYMAEEAVLEHFRRIGFVPRTLFEEYGLLVELVGSNARILHAFHIDDIVQSEVLPQTKPGDTELSYKVQLFVDRDGKKIKAYLGNVGVILRRDDTLGFSPCEKRHPQLGPFVTDRIARHLKAHHAPINAETSALDHNGVRVPPGLLGSNKPIILKVRIPYPYCHGNQRLRMSGYLRYMEAAEDHLLMDRGISIRHMLEAKCWIPVVPTVKMQIYSEAYMEETLYIVYALDEFVKDITYTCSMNCYAQRNDRLVHTAAGMIVHGYARIENRRHWTLVNLDEETMAALKGISANER
jgi:acyl-CoA thioesterase FadM